MLQKHEREQLEILATLWRAQFRSGLIVLEDKKARWLKASELEKLGLDEAGTNRVRKLIIKAEQLRGAFTVKEGSSFYNVVPAQPPRLNGYYPSPTITTFSRKQR